MPEGILRLIIESIFNFINICSASTFDPLEKGSNIQNIMHVYLCVCILHLARLRKIINWVDDI